MATAPSDPPLQKTTLGPPLGVDRSDARADAEPETHACTHCQLPVPAGLVEPGSDEQFCCGGCKTAYRLIRSCGLDAFYAMASPSDSAVSALKDRAASDGQRFKQFDDDVFREKFCTAVGERFLETTLQVDGIHCAACVWLIEKLPQMVTGVVDVKLNWARQTVKVRWDVDQTSLSVIAGTLHKLGYTPHPIHQSAHETRRQNANRVHLTRIGIAAAAAGNNMLIAGSLYLGMFTHMAADMTQLLRIASCIVGVAALAGPGRVFLRGAVAAMKTWTPHMDLPIALGLTVGTFAGIVNTIRGSGEIWFDSLSVLILLLLVGRWMQFRQQNRASDAVEMLYRLTPQMTHRLVDGVAVETFVDLIEVGDLLELRAGDIVPVDAEIVRGKAEVDESILSGESRPLSKSVGDTVLAGSQNLNSVTTVMAIATGQETRLCKIVEQVEQASLTKPVVVEWANRIGGYFVITVMVLALLTLSVWLWIDASVAVDRSVALLIVACPCALALATPLTISVALGRAAKKKIMIKGGDVLQRLNRPGTIWLDKTGTLTEGQLQVVRWHGDTRCKPLVAAIERKSSHPIARAIVDYVKRDEAQFNEEKNDQGSFLLGKLIQPTEIVGLGIKCQLLTQVILIGNVELLKQHDVSISRRHMGLAESILKEGLSPCWVAVDGRVAAVIAIGDQIRTDTLPALGRLRAAGWKLGILSGDHQKVVQRVANRLGIDSAMAFGGLQPEDKVRIVRESTREESISEEVVNEESLNKETAKLVSQPGSSPTVMMVGDGVNDSAALAAASVGIAVHGGAEACLAAAPVYLANQGITPIVELLQVSKSTSKTMRRNFVISVCYNLLGVTGAAIGWIDPLVAAILMPISALTVVTCSLNAGKTNSAKAKQ